MVYPGLIINLTFQNKWVGFCLVTFNKLEYTECHNVSRLSAFEFNL